MSMKTGDVKGAPGQNNNKSPKFFKKPVLEEKTNTANNASNNKKKFAFLSQETIPDYRPVEVLLFIFLEKAL
jgi:hypothetical protein